MQNLRKPLSFDKKTGKLESILSHFRTFSVLPNVAAHKVFPGLGRFEEK